MTDADGWLAIETHPRTAEPFLVYSAGTKKMSLARFDRVDEAVISTFRTTTKTIALTEATHWRPLPAPPKEIAP